MEKTQVENIAEGKVYSGKQAKELNLIDEIGTFEDAIAKAAELAEIEDFSSMEIRRPLSPLNQTIKTWFENEASLNIAELKLLQELANLQSTTGIYAYTPCSLTW